MGLDAASRMLRRVHIPEPTIPEAGRNDLLNDVHALIEEVASNEDLDRTAKLYVVRLLRDVEAALVGYAMGGFGDVMSAVAAVSAGVTRVKDDAPRSWIVKLVDRLWSATVSRAEGVQAIGGAVRSATEAIETMKDVMG